MATPRNPTFGLDVDYRAYVATLDEIGRKAMPKAAAETLNRAAFAAQKRLTKHARDVFDRPKPFTERAFIVQKAKPEATGQMASAVFAKDIQARYLWRQIVGGTRRTGDPGSGPRDLLAYSIRTDRHGGIPRGMLKKLSAQKRKEAADRASAAASGLPYRKQGGIFFGVVGGVKGYWRRPKRSGRGASTSGPTLLLAVADTMRYRVLFRYNEVIARAYAEFGAPTEFARELQAQIARIQARSSGAGG